MSTWKRSTRSSQNGQCMEWSFDHQPGMVAVRDSKNPDGPSLIFTHAEWEAFLDGARKGEADL
jgi:hypothetical protein